MMVSICFAFLNNRHENSITAIGFGVLPAVQSLISGNGLTICSDNLAKTFGNPICYHSARMPMAEWMVASGMILFGEHLLKIILLKTILLLLPLELALFIVWTRFSGPLRQRRFVFLLLLVPFTIIPFLTDVVRLDFEEAYSYSFIALAFAIALFLEATQRSVFGQRSW